MMVLPGKDRGRLVAAAMGRIPCDWTIHNVRLANVITGEIYSAEVDVLDGVIVRVRAPGEEVSARRRYDGGGGYLLPGYIDAHMHIESTMMVPENFGKEAVRWGTTTVVTDPHEIANVLGVEGVRYMLESAKRAPIRIYALAPSCVPSVPGLESAGARFGAEEVASLLEMEGVLGVAELMDYVGVCRGETRMREIIAEGLKRGMFLQGHAPGLSGAMLDAYLLAGPVSDHEAATAEEMRDKLRQGMRLNIKSSSLSDSAKEAARGIRMQRWNDSISLCTDDVHAGDLMTKGHINHVVAELVRQGVDPLLAIRMATFNAAREYNFEDLGAIALGRVADMQIVDSLDGARPRAVFCGGELRVENGDFLGDAAKEGWYPARNSVRIPGVNGPEDFGLAAPEGATGQVETLIFDAARDAIRGGLPTIYRALQVKNGFVEIPGDGELQYACVLNRHGAGSKTVVVCKNFGLREGAVASTISHDSHNMTIVYSSPRDAWAAAQELKRIGGGMCAVKDGRVLHSLALPVAGLMSPLPCRELAQEVERMNAAIDQLLGRDNTMLLRIALLALPVRPGHILTDLGVVNGDTQTFIPLFR